MTGLEIEKVQTGYMADSSQLYYKAYLPNDICWFVSTKDAKKYTGTVIINKAEDVLDNSYREENDVYIVCEDNGRIVVEGIAKPFTIKAGEETRLADVSGKKMRFIFDGILSFVIPFESFKLKGEPTTQEIFMRALIVVLLLLILCLIWKYRKQLLYLLKIRNRVRNSMEKGNKEFEEKLDRLESLYRYVLSEEKSMPENQNEDIKEIIRNEMHEITCKVSHAVHEGLHEYESLRKRVQELEERGYNTSNLIKNGIKVEGYEPFINFSHKLLLLCKAAEARIKEFVEILSVDDKRKIESIIANYYINRPTDDIEEWTKMLSTLHLCGCIEIDNKYSTIQSKNIDERKSYLEYCFFRDIIQPYVSCLLIYLEQIRTCEFLGVSLDKIVPMKALIANCIEEIIKLCHDSDIEIVYNRLFEKLNLTGEEYGNYKITYTKERLHVTHADVIDRNTLLSVLQYAINKKGYLRKRTECIVFDGLF